MNSNILLVKFTYYQSSRIPIFFIESSRYKIHFLLKSSLSPTRSLLPMEYLRESNMITLYMLDISLSLDTYGEYIFSRFKNQSKKRSKIDKSVMNNDSFFRVLMHSSINSIYSDSKIYFTTSMFLTLFLSLTRFFLKMCENLSSFNLSYKMILGMF